MQLVMHSERATTAGCIARNRDLVLRRRLTVTHIGQGILSAQAVSKTDIDVRPGFKCGQAIRRVYWSQTYRHNVAGQGELRRYFYCYVSHQTPIISGSAITPEHTQGHTQNTHQGARQLDP